MHVQAQGSLHQLVLLLASLEQDGRERQTALCTLMSVACCLAPLAYPQAEKTLAGRGACSTAWCSGQPCACGGSHICSYMHQRSVMFA